MLFSTYYSRNYAGIIDACLITGISIGGVQDQDTLIEQSPNPIL